MASKFLSVVISLLGVTGLVVAISSDANAACSVLAAAFPNQVAYNGLSLNATMNYDYQQATQRYWSMANADMIHLPACVFLPAAAQDVAYAVKILNTYTFVPWAVKGGGHNPNVGWSSSGGGVLIAMETMNSTTLDANNIAHIGSGARWGPAQQILDPYGRALVGGRLGDVGVGGFILGGGLSFLSVEHGFTSDTVTNMEVVTAAGEVTNANSTHNSDLFYAMKGGGNQFAIVTTYSLQTFPIGKVWGGHKIYTLDKKAAIINATHNLVSDYYDSNAAVIVTFSTTLLDLAEVFIIFYFYNDSVGPGSILAEFNAIEALADNTHGNWTYGDLLVDNSAFSLNGLRYLIREGTIPSLPADTGRGLVQYAFDSWYDLATKHIFGAPDLFIFSMAFQPVPYQLAQASVSSPNGGSCLGLSPETGDHIFLEYDLSWLVPSNDVLAAAYITSVTQPVQKYAKAKYSTTPPTHYQSGNLSFSNFNPVYMNDAMYNQRPLQSYGDAIYAKLSQIQRKADPKGFFSTRTGGWKYI